MKYLIWDYKTGAYLSEEGEIKEFDTYAQASEHRDELAQASFSAGGYEFLEDAEESMLVVDNKD